MTELERASRDTESPPMKVALVKRLKHLEIVQGFQKRDKNVLRIYIVSAAETNSEIREPNLDGKAIG